MRKYKKNRQSNIKNIINEKFGKLIVTKFSHIDKHRNAVWKCLCSCGNETLVPGNSLRSGLTKSCGCGMLRWGCIPWNKDKKIQTNTGKTHFKKGIAPWNKGVPYLKIKGKKHWNWKGGVSPKNDKIRKSIEYKEWRNAVYRRDNWTCQICKEKLTNRNIIAHHIKSFSKYIKLRFNIDNGITVCRKCHCSIHKKDLKP